jgi:drug/metabolite transporter (DMT)-like permease
VGYVFAVATAVLVAVSDVAGRRMFTADADLGEREQAALRLLLAAPLLLLLAPRVSVPTDPELLVVIAVGVPLEVIALLAYMRAIRSSSLATTLPLLAITPVVLLATGPLIANEPWSFAGAPGVALVAAGIWVLHLPTDGSSRLVAPLRAVASDRGARAMLVVVACYSVTAALGKRGATLAGPVTMAVWYYMALAAVMVTIAWPVRQRLVRAVRRQRLVAVVVSAAFGLHLLTHMGGIVLIPAAELIALKRLSVLLAPLLAHLLLRERLSASRLAGAVLMVAGATWLVVAGSD